MNICILDSSCRTICGFVIACAVYLACFPCLQFLPEGIRYLLFRRTSLFLCRVPLLITNKESNLMQYKPRGEIKICSPRFKLHSLCGEVWLDGSSVCFKAGSFGLADGSAFAEGDSVPSLSSPVFSSEPALLSSLSAAFSGTDAGSALEVCRGGITDRAAGGERRKLIEGRETS